MKSDTAPSRQHLLGKEQSYTKHLAWLMLLATLTGFVTWLMPGFTILEQWLWLAHTVLAVAMTLPLLPYLIIHIRRTLGFRRWGVFLGVISLVPLMALVITGWWLLVGGITEQTRFIFTVHQSSAVLVAVLILAHVVFHKVTLPKKRADKPALATLDKTHAHRGLKAACGTVVALAGALLFYQVIQPQYQNTPEVTPYTQEYGAHPFRPSQTETWHGAFVDRRQIANSKDCVSCHQQIGEEWLASAHRQAASDRSYVTNITLLAEKKGMAATRYCEGCHAPVALLTGQLTEGGSHGGISDTAAFDEGVGCLGCHGIQEAVHLDGVASYLFKPPADYLFGGIDHPLATKIRHALMRMRPQQHVSDMGRPVTRSPELCATCHVQFMDKDMNDWGWVKMQDEYSDWLNSPFSQQHDQQFSQEQRQTCTDCHMDAHHMTDDTSDDPSRNAQQQHKSHFFVGANTVLPLLAGDQEHLARTKAFLSGNKMRITLVEPRREDATQTLDALDETLRTQTQTPFFTVLGETVPLTVIVTNTGVGHSFPGGTIDINEAWVEVIATDANGVPLFQSGHLMPDNSVDPNALFYRSEPLDKAGNLVWKHDLFNRVGLAYKNVVKAGESDPIDYTFYVPDWTKGPITVTATLKYRKFNDRYARWALREAYQPIPIVDMAKASLVIPVKIKQSLAVDLADSTQQ